MLHLIDTKLCITSTHHAIAVYQMVTVVVKVMMVYSNKDKSDARD